MLNFISIPKQPQESVLGKVGAWILNQLRCAEAAKFKKFSDAGGFKSQDAHAAKNRFLRLFRYTFFCIFFFFSQAIAEELPQLHFISFIIPCFNCEKTVERSIASIYKQDLNYPFEIVCTDDGSSDNTRLILQTCEKKYPHITVCLHDKNKGGGAARNTCVLNSKGDLIFCLDSDNYLEPNSMNPLINLLDQTSSDIAVFNDTNTFCPIWGAVTKTSHNRTTETDVIDLYSCINRGIFGTPISSGNYLFTRKSYDRAGGYLADYGAVDTVAFGLAQFATGSKMVLLHDYFYWHCYSLGTGYWCRESLTNGPNYLKLLQYFSEIFDDESNLCLSNYLAGISSSAPSMKSASPIILESLFQAYEYRVEKKYLKAADAFATAVKYGCNSQKILQYIEEMKSLAKLAF